MEFQRTVEVARFFTRLGCTAFGGPAAHIALMEEEVVRRKGWLTHEEFLDLLGATNLIPGPNSTEMAIHIGQRRAGWSGLLAGGIGFILPASLMVTGLAWGYVHYGALPQIAGLLYGVKPVIIAVVAQALWGLTRAVGKKPFYALLGAGAVVLNLMGLHELLVLLLAAVLAGASRGFDLNRLQKSTRCWHFLGAAAVAPVTAATASAVSTPFSLGGLFLFFLKIGSVLFGSGYVLLAFLRADLVERWHWLTEAQLLDAVAVGQITPGPLFTTATFIGYFLGGPWAAVLATVGIFLPAFVFVALSGPLIPRIRSSPVAGAVLDGVNAASLALMAVVSLRLGFSAIVDWLTAAMAVTAFVLLWRYRVNSLWLILGGGLIGIVRLVTT